MKSGEVMLRGSVTSREQKRRAEDVAERISGVRDVTNQLRVTRDREWPQLGLRLVASLRPGQLPRHNL